MTLVVHVALTPLAGSPIRFVRAINNHASVSYRGRLITRFPNAYGSRTFPGDLAWESNREECVELLRSAAIVHFHHFFDLEQNSFEFNFARECREARFVRHLHTHPLTLASGDTAQARAIVDSAIPQLTTAQFHERFYPQAHPIRNIVEIPKAPAKAEDRDRIVFSPSTFNSAWTSRWDTKGYVEARRALRRLKRSHGVPYEIVRNQPFEQCLRLKNRAMVGIDDISTGSYHISSLEFMAAGIPVICRLDARVASVVSSITGSMELPWINVEIPDLYTALRELTEDRSLYLELGERARDWMLVHWQPDQIVEQLAEKYNELLSGNWIARYPKTDVAQQFTSRRQYDFAWNRNRVSPMALWSRSSDCAKAVLRNCARRIRSASFRVKRDQTTAQRTSESQA